MEAELRVGTVGEYIVWNLYSRMKGVKSVVDVRDDAFFREVDVDFLVEDLDRQFHWLEVKTDSMADKTGNIAYEKVSSKTYNTKGCFAKTKAEFIAYYIPGLNKVYEINVSLLREYVDYSNLKEVPMGDNAIGYLIPIRELIVRKIITREYAV